MSIETTNPTASILGHKRSLAEVIFSFRLHSQQSSSIRKLQEKTQADQSHFLRFTRGISAATVAHARRAVIFLMHNYRSSYRQPSPPSSSSKHQMREYILKEQPSSSGDLKDLHKGVLKLFVLLCFLVFPLVCH